MSCVWRSHELQERWVAVPRYMGSRLIGVLGDAAELEEVYTHDKQVL